MKASEVALELRRVADALDKKPDLDVRAFMDLGSQFDDKNTFIELASIMPRPSKKGIDFPGTSYEKFSLHSGFWSASIPRNKICTLIEPAKPAKYDCPSIFSEEEEIELGNM